MSSSCYGKLPPLPSSRKSSLTSSLRSTSGLNSSGYGSLVSSYHSERSYDPLSTGRRSSTAGSSGGYTSSYSSRCGPTDRSILSHRRSSVGTSNGSDRDLTTARFGVMESTVITKRNFGLLRDTSGPNLASQLQSVKKLDAPSEKPDPVRLNTRRGSAPNPQGLDSAPQTSGEAKISSEELPTPTQSHPLQKSRSIAIGEGGVGDRSCSNWLWPLKTQPKVKNEEKIFEAEFDVYPYTTRDVWARIMGSELMINLNPDDDDDYDMNGRKQFNPKRLYQGYLRPINRTYQLPLNLDCKSVKFRFKKDHIFIISAAKIPMLQLAVACYIDKVEMDDVLKRKLLEDSETAKVVFDTDISAKNVQDSTEHSVALANEEMVDENIAYCQAECPIASAGGILDYDVEFVHPLYVDVIVEPLTFEAVPDVPEEVSVENKITNKSSSHESVDTIQPGIDEFVQSYDIVVPSSTEQEVSTFVSMENWQSVDSADTVLDEDIEFVESYNFESSPDPEESTTDGIIEDVQRYESTEFVMPVKQFYVEVALIDIPTRPPSTTEMLKPADSQMEGVTVADVDEETTLRQARVTNSPDTEDNIYLFCGKFYPQLLCELDELQIDSAIEEMSDYIFSDMTSDVTSPALSEPVRETSSDEAYSSANQSDNGIEAQDQSCAGSVERNSSCQEECSEEHFEDVPESPEYSEDVPDKFNGHKTEPVYSGSTDTLSMTSSWLSRLKDRVLPGKSKSPISVDRYDTTSLDRYQPSFAPQSTSSHRQKAARRRQRQWLS